LVELGTHHSARAGCGVLGAATVITKHVLANRPLLNQGLALSFSLFGLTRTPLSISPIL
jgi:hypothetical protein